LLLAISVSAWIWDGALTVTCAAAAWKGGRSERYAAGACYGAWIATLLVHNPNRYVTQWAVFGVDVLLFLLLAALALRSHRYWPMFMAGFQLLAVITHAGRILDKTVGAWAYLTAAQIWGYLVVYTLAFATWGRWRERRQLAAMAAAEGMAEPGATRL
jgi:hypothetical protein